MNILLNTRQKIVIGVSVAVIIGSIAFVALAPRGDTQVAPTTPAPMPTQTQEPTPVTPSTSPTPDINAEYERIDDIKSRAAVDMAMALVAQIAAIDYRKTPEQVIQGLRPMASTPVLVAASERLQAIDWADIQRRQYWLHAEIAEAVPLAPAGSTSDVPTKVQITVDLFEVQPNGNLKPVGRQVWEVGVGQGEGKSGWLATSLAEIG